MSEKTEIRNSIRVPPVTNALALRSTTSRGKTHKLFVHDHIVPQSERASMGVYSQEKRTMFMIPPAHIASDATRDETENAQGRTDSDVRPVDALLAGFLCQRSHVCNDDDVTGREEMGGGRKRRRAAFN